MTAVGFKELLDLFGLAGALPALLYLIFKFIPAMRRRPIVMNVIPAVIGVLCCFVGVSTSFWERLVVVCVIAAGFICQCILDKRAVARLATPVSGSTA
jgi:hypothetical protein